MTLRLRTTRLSLALVLAVAGLALALLPAAANATSRTFGATTLALDPGTAQALESLGVAPGVIAPATAGADGLAFPIVTAPRQALLNGRVRHTGGISLTAGHTRVELRNFEIDLDRASLSALVGTSRVRILDLDFGSASLALEGGSLRIGSVNATLTRAAANALNGAFGVTAFTRGLDLGDVSVDYRILPRR